METSSLFVLDILVFLDDVISLVDTELASFGEVRNGMGRVVKEEVKDATIEVGFCKMIVLFDDAGEASDGIVDVACLCFLEGVFEGVDEVSHACINDGKLLGSTLLDVEGTCDKRPHLSNYSSSQFEV